MEEPSINDAIAVIRGVKGYYEKYHCVRVPDSIVADVVHLSERYITDRYLPDKAIDLLDESCACCNLRHPEITEFLNLQKQVAELETREHDLENPDPEKQGDAAIDYEELAKTKTELAQLAMFALLVAFASATQDIVIDAYRIESAPERLQAAMAASYMTGYRLAMIMAGAGALALAAQRCGDLG